MKPPEPFAGCDASRFLSLCVALFLIFRVSASFAQAETPSPDRLPNLPKLNNLDDFSTKALEPVYEANELAVKSPEDAEAVGNFGIACHAAGLPRKAYRAYARAALLEPGDWRWHYYSALALMDSRMPEKASGALQRAVELRPEFSPAWYWLGISLIKQELPDAARAALTRAAETSAFYELDQMARPGPRSKTPTLEFYAALALAGLATDEGQPREALDLLGNWLETYPDCADLHQEIARASQALGMSERASKAAEFAAISTPLVPPGDPLRDQLGRISQNPDVLLDSIYLASRAQDKEWAIFLAERAYKLVPGDPETAMQLGLLYIGEDRPSDGLPLLDKVLQSPEIEPVLLDKAAMVLLRYGYDELSEKFFRRSLERDPNQAEVYFHLASVLGQRDDWEEAITQAGKGLDLEPDNLDMHFDYGMLLIGSNRPEQAIAQFQRLLEKTPDSAPVLFQLGELHTAQQNYREAAECYSKALEIDPEMTEASRGLRYAFERIPDETSTNSSDPLTSLN